MPPVHTACTMRLARALWDLPCGRSLEAMSRYLAISHPRPHLAVDDARATAAIFARALSDLRSRRIQLESVLGRIPLPAEGDAWPTLVASAAPVRREAASAAAMEERAFLRQMVSRLASKPSGHADLDPYLEMLDRALEDRLLTSDELEGLLELAERMGLSSADVEEAHSLYYDALVAEAWSDGMLSEAERGDLADAGHWLAIPPQRVGASIDASDEDDSQWSLPHKDLRGLSVCFTGELVATIRGDRVTREMAHQLARAAGLSVEDRVTKTLDLLVVADPSTLSGKARKARQYGTRIMADEVFFVAIGADID